MQTSTRRAAPPLLVALAAALFLGQGAAAETGTLPVPSEELVFCTVCHGIQLMGNENLAAPRLSGLSDWYVEQQLTSFRNGWRGTHEDDLVGMEMQPMAAGLSDAQIERAATFVAATHSPLPPVTIDADSDAGRDIYTSCAACHGDAAEGSESLGAPALAGQNDWYLLRQIENYRAGVRGYDEEDVRGRQMQAASGLLVSEQAVRDVVAYINTLTITSQ